MKKRIALLAIAGVISLTGCSYETTHQRQLNEIEELDNKITELSNDLYTIKTELRNLNDKIEASEIDKETTSIEDKSSEVKENENVGSIENNANEKDDNVDVLFSDIVFDVIYNADKTTDTNLNNSSYVLHIKIENNTNKHINGIKSQLCIEYGDTIESYEIELNSIGIAQKGKIELDCLVDLSGYENKPTKEELVSGKLSILPYEISFADGTYLRQ